MIFFAFPVQPKALNQLCYGIVVIVMLRHIAGSLLCIRMAVSHGHSGSCRQQHGNIIALVSCRPGLLQGHMQNLCQAPDAIALVYAPGTIFQIFPAGEKAAAAVPLPAKVLPLEFLERFRDRCIRLPMIAEARSLNLSNTVAVCVYEALRQAGFPGLLDAGEMGETL